MHTDLTKGSVTRAMLLFALPMICGNLLQQCYNVADTLIVGRFLGSGALAAVGASFTLMTFLTSVLLGLCMGSGAFFSMAFGARDEESLKRGIFVSFVLIAMVTALLTAAVFAFTDPILRLLQIPTQVYDMTRSYLRVIFLGLGFTFLYNFFASLLRSLGNSAAPLLFLCISAVLNIALDLFFVVTLRRGVAGAAEATVLAQCVSALLITLYALAKLPQLRLERRHLRMERKTTARILSYSLLTCAQQSVMNFGILMIQGLVNSFGVAVMAAFAAAVKIDAFAYMPVQDFGNAFSIFIAQNYGAGETARIRSGVRAAVRTALIFCLFISLVVVLLARPLMGLFISLEETEIIAIGAQYLRIEGLCYCGIGCLFLLYGLYRGLGRPVMSVVLTVLSLGTRVALAYLLAPIPAIGLVGIWWAIPVGWFLADAVGFGYYLWKKPLHAPLHTDSLP